jgi:hypothetical protein
MRMDHSCGCALGQCDEAGQKHKLGASDKSRYFLDAISEF